MSDEKLSRRDLLAGGAAAVGAAATASAAVGCASLPRRGAAPVEHPCDHRFCRYHAAADGGRCTLALRLAGGTP